jgi:isoleucyl-tRNA synthetase
VSEELNVKRLEVVESLAGLIRYSVVPNFRALGPRLGPKLPAVKAALASADGAEVSRSLEETGSYTVVVDGEPVVLGRDDLEVRAQEHEEFALAQDGPFAVALDLKIDDDLKLEGLARELARAINDHRRALGLAIADRVKVRLWATGPVAEAAERHGAWIAGEVLAVGWQVNPDEEPEGAVLDVEGTPVTVSVEVAG